MIFLIESLEMLNNNASDAVSKGKHHNEPMILKMKSYLCSERKQTCDEIRTSRNAQRWVGSKVESEADRTRSATTPNGHPVEFARDTLLGSCCKPKLQGTYMERSTIPEETFQRQISYEDLKQILWSGYLRTKRIPVEEVKQKWRERQTVKQRQLLDLQWCEAPYTAMSWCKKVLSRGRRLM